MRTLRWRMKRRAKETKRNTIKGVDSRWDIENSSPQCYYTSRRTTIDRALGVVDVRSSRHWVLYSPGVRTTSSSIELIKSDQRTQFHTYQCEPSQFLVQWFEHEIPRKERERQSPNYNDWRQSFLSKKNASFEQQTWTDWIPCHLVWRSNRFVPLDQLVSREGRSETMFTHREQQYHIIQMFLHASWSLISHRQDHVFAYLKSSHSMKCWCSTARMNRTCWIWLAGSGYRRTKGLVCINTKSVSEPSLHERIRSDCRESPPCPDRSNDSFVFDTDPTIWNTEGY